MQNETNLSIANRSFAEGELSSAMMHYLEALDNGKLAKHILPNILMTVKKFHQKNLDHIYISDHKSYIHEDWTKIVSLTGKIIIHSLEKLVPLEEKNIQIFEYTLKELPSTVLDFVIKNPATKINILGGNPTSILLGLIYLVVWDADVQITSEPKISPKKLKYYFTNVLDESHLAIVFFGISKKLFTLMSTATDKNSKIYLLNHVNFLKFFNTHQDVFNAFQSQDYDLFITTLFKFALGRPAAQNELNHFVSQLNSKNLTKSEIGMEVLTGDESLRFFKDRHAPKKKLNYPVPNPGDINPLKINIPNYKNPLVSIIIPVFRKVEFTLSCLESIAENTDDSSFEILVVDDCSGDGSISFLKQIKNIRVIENKTNLGFLRSCNYGAEFAQGKFLYFLNNDTLVKSGWLNELVKTFDNFPNVGLAGSKLIYPDGSLQEAGGIIWKDGSAWNFGRNQDANDPKFNYAREVDYISGASILVPKVLFNKFGGFDERYVPAYCEDSDLALTLRNAGYSVIYQPLSEIVHFEGITSGTDTASGVKSFQVTNLKKLFDKWSNFFLDHRDNGVDSDLEKDRNCKFRVLVIDHCTPSPDLDAGSITSINSMLILRDLGFQVTFIPEDNFLYIDKYTKSLQRAGIEVLYSPYINSIDDHLIECGDRYDLIFFFRPRTVQKHINSVNRYCKKAKKLFHTVDLHFLRLKREGNLTDNLNIKDEAEEIRKIEFDAIKSVDLSIVHSQEEFEILRKDLPGANITVFPLIMEIPKAKNTFSDRKDILFVGGFQHTPNIDAVSFMVNSIMPELRKKASNLKFHVVGSNVTNEIESMSAKDVVIHGFVEDLTSMFEGVLASVAPLRYGAGIKGKIGNSMAHGVPVIATSIAAEGMGLIDEENIIIADDPLAFADAILRICNEKELWLKISQNSSEFASNKWGGKAAAENFKALLLQIGFKVDTAKYKEILYSPLFL
jgi:GT2 family glycosyltransferase/glycosyltransferase involved in cell wall biosynthesis